MNICIDISQMAYEGTGVTVYTRNLVENLLKIDKKNEYRLFYSSLRRKTQNSKLKTQNYNLKLKAYKFPQTSLDFLWNRIHVLPIEYLVGNVDIYHSSDWVQAPSRAKKVTTIHDLAIYKYPKEFPQKIVEVQKRRLNWVKKEIDHVIVVSQSTKRDVIDILKIPENKIAVIYEAAAQEFHDFVKLDSVVKKEKIEVMKKQYGIKADYLLTVGTREPRKNLQRVIEASEKVRGVNLVVVGKFGWGDNNLKFKIKNLKLKILNFVPQTDLPALYAGARCLIYPSLYEGFGLPVIEAMTVGCPVITSNISSLPEVAGEAGIYIDPYKVSEIREAMKMVLHRRTPWYRQKVNQSLKQAAKFSWQKAARETLKIYERLQ